ncbi:IucA/IucC family protein [Streptomyces sp. NPDC002776]
MNTTRSSDEHTPRDAAGLTDAEPPTPTAATVPRQQGASPELSEPGTADSLRGRTAAPSPERTPAQRGGPDAAPSRRPAADLLEHPDPYTAAQAAAVENLLRCWVREVGLPAPTDGFLRIPLPASGTALLARVHFWSPTGWHRFGLPRMAGAPDQAPTADAVTVAALLAREAPEGAGPGAAPSADGGVGPASPPRADEAPAPRAAPAPPAASAPPASAPGDTPAIPGVSASADATHSTDLAARVADSVRRTALFISDRRDRPADGPDLFLSAEQALVLGHPLHPTPKGREGLSDSEARLYSPELRGSFPLHWIAVAPSLLATDSAWTERGRPVAAPQLTARLAGPGLPLPDTYAALPLHPWQLREASHRPEVAALFDAGLLRDLGPHGVPWHPTSSVRTVHRSGAPAMLKLSLGLCITNSRRENLRKELHRGVEVHRLLRAGLAGQWQTTHPGFDIVRDPAWVAVDGPQGDPVPGLDVMIRHNPFHPAADVSCIAGLVSPRPYAEPGAPRDGHRPAWRSRLAEVVTRLAARTGRPRGAVSTEWFLRYLEHVVRPVLWLDANAGIALEAHQQNTLLLLDSDGWPSGGRYRDNQGYYFRESRRAELDARLPGIGRHSDTFVSDEVTDERFAYYLAINNVFGLIGAFGSQGLADERLLLAAFRRFLGDVASGPARLRTSLPAHLLDSPTLRCKANLLTRLHGLDELVGPVDTQSVYVTIANPLHS